MKKLFALLNDMFEEGVKSSKTFFSGAIWRICGSDLKETSG
jgi:hypothetical protein